MNDGEPSAAAHDLASETLRKINETHEAALRTHAMVLDMYNIVVYGVMPPKNAVPPHPKGKAIKKKIVDTTQAVDVVDALGRLIGQFRKR